MESVRYADVRRKEEDGRILKTAAGKQKGKHDQSQSLLLRDLIPERIKSFLGTTSEAEQDYENHRENCSEPTCGTFRCSPAAELKNCREWAGHYSV